MGRSDQEPGAGLRRRVRPETRRLPNRSEAAGQGPTAEALGSLVALWIRIPLLQHHLGLSGGAEENHGSNRPEPVVQYRALPAPTQSTVHADKPSDRSPSAGAPNRTAEAMGKHNR